METFLFATVFYCQQTDQMVLRRNLEILLSYRYFEEYFIVNQWLLKNELRHIKTDIYDRIEPNVDEASERVSVSQQTILDLGSGPFSKTKRHVAEFKDWPLPPTHKSAESIYKRYM